MKRLIGGFFPAAAVIVALATIFAERWLPIPTSLQASYFLDLTAVAVTAMFGVAGALRQTKAVLDEFTTIRRRRADRAVPPINAEFILHLILSSEKCDDQVNSLEELYAKKRARLGSGRADIWYWKQVIGLVWRQLFRGRAKTAVVKLVCWALRICGMGTLADALTKAAAELTSAAPQPSNRRRP